MTDSTGAARTDAEAGAVSHSRRRRVTLLAVTAAVVAVLVVAAIVWATRPSPRHTAAAPPPKPLASPAPPTSSAPASTAMTTPAPKKKPAVPHDYVAAAAPSSFAYAGAGYTIRADVCGMEYVRPLDPPGNQHHTVCWVQHDFGYAPGSKSRGTTYVLGHSWGQDSQEVLNKISEAAMRQVLKLRDKGRATRVSGIPTYQVSALDGDVITLRTGSGLLKYTVRNAYAVAKAQAGNVTPLMADTTRNRVVIITCGELDHVDYDYNIIVQAYLTSSKAIPSNT